MLRIGKLVATHGVQGDLILTHITGKTGWLKAGDVLFVALRKGSHIPYFISKIKRDQEEEIILHLEDTDLPETAKMLVGKEVFVEEKVLATIGQDSPLLWIGFEAIDEQAGSLGPVEDVYQTAQQWLATVHFRGKEALLPLIDQTLLKIDIPNRKLYLSIPEGLLEVYA
ncbi:MAG: 16S rRNA processing protein RimM [Bacteroidetes bacterium]|nr:16S rRNA processing protein RimM [Bacteroidota bacterium]MBS1628794.1 16S rRNA processing protein RimM [Bacteroidota bacterium]